MVTAIAPLSLTKSPERWAAALDHALHVGVEIYITPTGERYASSGGHLDLIYRVTPTTCECDHARLGDVVCCHRAALRFTLGTLPVLVLDDSDVTPDPTGQDASSSGAAPVADLMWGWVTGALRANVGRSAFTSARLVVDAADGIDGKGGISPRIGYSDSSEFLTQGDHDAFPHPAEPLTDTAVGEDLMPHASRAVTEICGVTFEFALVRRWCGETAHEPFHVELATDMVRLRYAVRLDDTWTVEIGEHPSVADGMDLTLRTMTDDGLTRAVQMLRVLAGQVVFPHSLALVPATE